MILTSADSSASALASALLLHQQQQQRNNNNKNTKIPLIEEEEDTVSPSLSQPGLHIMGPTGTQRFIHSLRHFMRREKFPVSVEEGSTTNGPKQIFLAQTHKHETKHNANKKNGNAAANNATREVAFSIESLAFSIQNLNAHANANANTGPGTFSSTRKHPRSEGEQSADSSYQNLEMLSFIIRTPPVTGKFLAKEAMALGVPKGPLFGRLKMGQSVTFTDSVTQQERTVHSAQVVAPETPAVGVFILYYPNREICQKLFADQRLLSAAAESPDMLVELVIHIAPYDLFQEYGMSFWRQHHQQHNSIEHIWLSTCASTDVDGTPFRSASQSAHARALLSPDIYQVPRVASHISSPSSLSSTTAFTIGTATMEYTLIPRSKRGYRIPDSFEQPNDILQAATLVEETGAMMEAQKERVVPLSPTPTGELFFTGTGAAMPCKHRNVTGMLLRQEDGRSILLDVGEGTIGQLLRAQTSEDYNGKVLSDIKAVWISHPHADHHLGLLTLLDSRESDEPVLLLAPTPIFRFLEEYAEINPTIYGSYFAIDCNQLVDENAEIRNKLQVCLGISNCRSVPVAHCAHAYAAIIDGTCFGRVVYSGDCRPSAQLAQAALGADLLIHEATFEDGMEAEAALKKHSTVGEALAIGQAMKCRCTILTHFSQRYPKIPPMPTGEYSFPIIFAFDFMKLQAHTLVVASKMTPAIRLLFPEQTVEKGDRLSSMANMAMSVPGAFAMKELL